MHLHLSYKYTTTATRAVQLGCGHRCVFTPQLVCGLRVYIWLATKYIDDVAKFCVPWLVQLVGSIAVSALQIRAELNKAIVDIRLRPRFGAAPWWVSFSIQHHVKSLLPPLSQFQCMPIFCSLWPFAIIFKKYVIHKTGNT